MRIYPGTTVDYEFATLGGLGYTGTLNDRQFAALRADGLTGSLADMFKQFDGTLGGGGPTLSEQVEAALLGTNDFVLDMSDPLTMWLESTKVTQVSAAADPVGALRTKWNNAPFDLGQGTAASRPAWNGVNAIAGDNVDKMMAPPSSLLQNVPAFFWSEVVKPSSLAADNPIISFSEGVTATSPRFRLMVLANGSVQLSVARLDGDATSTITTAAGLVTTGAQAVVSAQADYAGGGDYRIWVNGTLRANGTMAGVAGNTSNTVGLRQWFMSSLLSGGARTEFNGLLGRAVGAFTIPDATKRALFESWIAETAL